MPGFLLKAKGAISKGLDAAKKAKAAKDIKNKIAGEEASQQVVTMPLKVLMGFSALGCAAVTFFIIAIVMIIAYALVNAFWWLNSDSASASEAGGSRIVGNGEFANPAPDATMSSDFGYRTFDNSFHNGIDLAAPEGTPYYAAADGTVIIAGWSDSAGNWIVIDHGGGVITKYMHSSAIYVSVGDTVTKGQNIGAIGNTGNSFGAHLHFQVEVNVPEGGWSGEAVDPKEYIGM